MTLIFFNRFLTQEWSSSRFTFCSFLHLQLYLKLLDCFLHLIMLWNILLRLSTLIFKLKCQHLILKNCQLSSTHHLLLVLPKHFYFYSPYFQQHLLTHIFDLTQLFVVYFFNSIFQIISLFISVFKQLISLCSEAFNISFKLSELIQVSLNLLKLFLFFS